MSSWMNLGYDSVRGRNEKLFLSQPKKSPNISLLQEILAQCLSVISQNQSLQLER